MARGSAWSKKAWWIAGIAAALAAPILLFSGGAGAQGVLRAQGVWSGSYTCSQGLTGLTLQVQDRGGGRVDAVFHFYEDVSNPGVPEGCYRMSGTFDPVSGALDLEGGDWILQPEGWVTTDLSGTVAGDRYTGVVQSPRGSWCTTFEVRRRAPTSRPIPAACRLSAPAVAAARSGAPAG